MVYQKKATTIGVVSTKGGVHKTTTTINLGTYLAKYLGKKVLLVDCDHIQTLSLYFGLYDEADFGLVEVLKQGSTNNAISTLPKHGIDLIYNNDSEAENDTFLRQRADAAFTLDKSLRDIKSEYDFIIIDLNPNALKMVQTVITASDLIVTPIPLESLPTRETYRKTIPLVRNMRDSIGEYLGRPFAKHVAFFIESSRITANGIKVKKAILDQRENYPDMNLIDVTIYKREIFKKAASLGLSVFDIDYPEKKQIKEWYGNLIKELLVYISEGNHE